MNKILLQFFAVNKKISIPKLGTLSVQTQSSEDNFGKKIIVPSRENIVFTNDVDDKTINDFESYAQNNFQKTQEEIKNYFNNLFDILQKQNTVNLDGLGVLEYKDEIINFQSTYSSENFFPTITVEKVIHQDAEHTITVGENERTSTQMREALTKNDAKKYWWVYILIVLLIGAAGYFFYTFYFQK